MNKHEELVCKIAEEMAEAQYKKSFNEIAGGSPFMPGFKFDPNSRIAQSAIRSIAQTIMPAALIAVKHMAEVFDEGFQLGFDYDAESKTLYEEMVQRGLLPAKDTATRKE